MRRLLYALAFIVFAVIVAAIVGLFVLGCGCIGDTAVTAARFSGLRADHTGLRAFLRAMPKGADLHVHLSGAVYAEDFIGNTAVTAARFSGLRADHTGLRAFLRAMPKGADLHVHLSGAVYAEDFIGNTAVTAARFSGLRADHTELRAFLKAMPKGADLHVHLSGAVYAEDFIGWAAAAKLCVQRSDYKIVPPDSQQQCGDPRTRPAADALTDQSFYDD